MKKKIYMMLIMVSLIITMIIPAMAESGHGEAEDKFTEPSVSMNLYVGKYPYTPGEYMEFGTETWCGDYEGIKAVREMKIEGPSVSDLEYYDGKKWDDVSKYNTTISLKNDRGGDGKGRKFHAKFNAVGTYIITFSLKDEEGALLSGSRRYLTVTETGYEVKLPITPVDDFKYKKTDDNSSYSFSWSKKNQAVSYDFYIDGKRIDSVTTNSYNVSSAYFKENRKYVAGVVAVNEAGLESVMKTLVFVVQNGTVTPIEPPTPKPTEKQPITTTKKTPSTEKKTTAKEGKTSKTTVKKPSKVKSVNAKNLKGKKVKLTWKKIKSTSGYQIMYSTDRKLKKHKKTITIKKASTTKKTISRLKKNKTYYFRVRAYNKKGNIIKYGSWSSIQKAKIKK